MAPEIAINREQWQRIEQEFGQGGKNEPLGGTRVQLDDTGFHAEFRDGQGDVRAWATQKSTRVDTGDLSLYVSQTRVLLLKRLGPYPIAHWQVLYDSKPREPMGTEETDQWGTTWTASDVNRPDFGQNMTKTDQLLNAKAEAAAVRQQQDLMADPELIVQQLITVLRDGLGLYYQGQVDETDPAVPLVKDTLSRAIADWGNAAIVEVSRADMTQRAIDIVRAVRSLVPVK